MNEFPMHTMEAARHSLVVIRQEMRLHGGGTTVPNISRLRALREASKAILDRWPKLREAAA